MPEIRLPALRVFRARLKPRAPCCPRRKRGARRLGRADHSESDRHPGRESGEVDLSRMTLVADGDIDGTKIQVVKTA